MAKYFLRQDGTIFLMGLEWQKCFGGRMATKNSDRGHPKKLGVANFFYDLYRLKNHQSEILHSLIFYFW